MHKDQQAAILAHKSGILFTKITIHADADFTPKGKRRVQVVQPQAGCYGQPRKPRHIGWYVGQRCYARLAFTEGNIALSREWVSAK